MSSNLGVSDRPETNPESLSGMVLKGSKSGHDGLGASPAPLSAVTSILSHDLRNPLNVAAGRTKLIDGADDSGHVDAIKRSLERMEVIIEDALVLALQSKTTNLCHVDLERRARTAWNYIETGHVILGIAESAQVRTDPNLLRHAFENLYRNAVEHAGSHAWITVGRTDGGFYVEDDGSGIPVDQRVDVFKAGFAANQDGGTGLSWPIVERSRIGSWMIGDGLREPSRRRTGRV